MKQIVKRLLSKAGLRVYRERFLPFGMDWTWDIARETGGADGVRVICDVGANNGTVSAQLASTFPQAIVHAFEPVRTTFATLRERHATCSRIRAHNVAVGESEGRVEMSCEPNAEYNRITAGGGEWVTVVRLDRFLGEHGIEDVDILKSDTEGFDIGVLRGAGRLVSEARIPFVLVECSFDRAEWHTPLNDFVSLLRPYGYNLFGLYDISHCVVPRRIHWMNALFVSPRVGHPS